MIERVDIRSLIDLVEDERVARGLSQAAMSAGGRLHQLGRCRWYRDGDRLAVFRPEMPGEWAALVFEVEPLAFSCAVLDAMFDDLSVERVSFTTPDAEFGSRLNAVLLGKFMAHSAHAWWISRAQWREFRKVGVSTAAA